MPPPAANRRADHLVLPHPSRLAPNRPDYAAIQVAHAAAVAAGRDRYRDPATGLEVFTAAFLDRRGWCCEAGCRHCPFVGAG